jgi:hypothetical protein
MAIFPCELHYFCVSHYLQLRAIQVRCLSRDDACNSGTRIFREYPEIQVFPAISRVGVPHLSNKKNDPQFILSTLKCNSVKSLKTASTVHKTSFYSSNLCSFTCAVMLWFAKCQVFFVSTILILDNIEVNISLLKLTEYSWSRKCQPLGHTNLIVWIAGDSCLDSTRIQTGFPWRNKQWMTHNRWRDVQYLLATSCQVLALLWRHGIPVRILVL